MPPSAKLVCYALHANDGSLTYSELRNDTKLPDTTLARGLNDLAEQDRIEETADGYRLLP